MISTYSAGTLPAISTGNAEDTAFFNPDGVDIDAAISLVPSPELNVQWAVLLPNGEVWSSTRAARPDGGDENDPPTLFGTRESVAAERDALVRRMTGPYGVRPQHFRPVLVYRAITVGTDGRARVGEWQVDRADMELDSVLEAVIAL